MKLYRDFFKRFFDIVISGGSLLVFLIPLTAIIIWLHFANKKAGVFFLQERPGLHGKIFRVVKFKSMTDERDGNGKLLPNEQRITKVGKFIRNTSIDELPQLWNVLKGDMSLIGPRPLPVRYLELYSSEQARRHDVRPGITGWAQVHGRNTISWTKKFEYDVYYVDNLSFILDMKTLFLTFYKVLKHVDIDANAEKVGGIGFNGHN